MNSARFLANLISGNCIKSADVKNCFAWLHFFQIFQNLFQDLRQQRQKVEDIGLMYHVVGEPIRNIEG